MTPSVNWRQLSKKTEDLLKENPTISRQAEVDAQIQSLVEAVAGLTVAETPVEYADLTELNDAIAKAEKVNPEGYTSESLASMNNLLKAARELAASKPEKSLESTVSTVKNALLAAMSGLVKVEVPSEKQYADLTALNKEIGKAKAVRTDSYTEKISKRYEDCADSSSGTGGIQAGEESSEHG